MEGMKKGGNQKVLNVSKGKQQSFQGSLHFSAVGPPARLSLMRTGLNMIGRIIPRLSLPKAESLVGRRSMQMIEGPNTR